MAGLDACADEQTERCAHEGAENQHRNEEGEVDVEADRSRRDDERHREDEQSGNERLHATGRHLLERNGANRQRGEDSVFDLAREAEVLDEWKRNRLDPLEDHRARDDAANEECGEPPRARATPDALPDLGKDVGEHEHQQQRLDDRSGEEHHELLAEHGEVPSEQRDERCPGGGLHGFETSRYETSRGVVAGSGGE